MSFRPSMSPVERKRLEKLLDTWRDSLIDLSFRNRLLSYQRSPRAAGMDIVEPGLLSVLEALGGVCGFAEVKEPAAAAPGTAMAVPTVPADSRPIDTPASRRGVRGRRPAVHLTTSKTSQAEQDRHLKRLAAVAREKYNDYGIWVLHLGVGFLEWKPAPTADKALNSPLIMVPVVLERRGDSYVLKLNADEEPVLNPALGIKMSELGVDWPRPDQVEIGAAADLIGGVRRAVAGRRGWKVSSRVVLDTFNSSKEVMYRDLLENADRVMGSDLVRALGLGTDSGVPAARYAFEPADIERIDAVQPPENAPMVLDADSSQRQCVAAALEGCSFVMDGPPGTGKSQTITNMIAGLLEKGRTVLFVSEKAAALDVVRNRLADVGLGDYVLALHSNTAGRKQVAQELGKALAAPRRTVSGGSQVELGQAKKLRKELSGYAAAMNEVRPEVGMSLHDALGRIARAGTADPLPASDAFDPARLSEQGLAEAENAARQVASSWRPALEGADFSWYGLKNGGNALRALDLAREELGRLDSALTCHADLLDALGWDGVGDAARLVTVLRTAGSRPAVPLHWLTADPQALGAQVRAFLERMKVMADAEHSAEQALGGAWDRLPAGGDPQEDDAEAALSALTPQAVELAPLTADGARDLAQRLESDAAALEDAARSTGTVARLYGLPEPATCDDVLRLGRLAALAALPDEAKPLPAWLRADGLATARTAARALRESSGALLAARQSAGVFAEDVLCAESLGEVAERFATVHRSFAGALSAARRADRRLVATWLTGGGKVTKAVIGALPAAVAWQQAARAHDAATRAHAQSLGPLWRGADGAATDFARVDELIARAEEIAALAPDIRSHDLLARELAAGGDPRPQAQQAAEEAAARLTEWRTSLVLPPTPGPSYELETGSLLAAAAWSRAHVAPLRAAERLIRVVEESAAAGGGGHLAAGTWTLAASRAAVLAVRDARVAAAAFESTADSDRALLGGLHAGRETSPAALAGALEWLAGLRAACGTDATTGWASPAAELLHAARPDGGLESAEQRWAHAFAGLADLFRADRAGRLRVASRSGQTVHKALDVLSGDRGGPDEWHAYDQGRHVLDRLGLGDLVDRAARRGIQPADFPRIVERAVLRAWADAQLSIDKRLSTTRSVDRDGLVARFRELDAKLAEHARARVITMCEKRRPRKAVDDGAALIRREGEKKSRHKPVRELLDTARDTVRLIKPCFMMSPLTVSRFLPPDIDFDVVIFDEASQVLPQDAVNCIYRGRSLIIAGDKKQLPPTAFFSSMGDDEEAEEELPERYESVLNMGKASGLLPSLSLRWHYRSRHEALIAFSNHEFYDGSLVTFPGAHAEGEDVGVAFFRALDGVYRSGAAARDNPGEAAEVARRVMHHFTTRKGKSLGVVALSQPQALAIQDAVDAARRQRPDLDECFSEGRLDGFFVKNLESVQGDERDVMIMSVGYARDMTGKFSMNFGPMNNEANGWRRLNVVTTRARYRMEVVASFDPGEMRETSSRSQRYFQRYLRYAQSGPAALATAETDPQAEPESPFEESVLAVLRKLGHDVQPQVGVAGYRIDLGVRHPRLPGRYVLGVECDGAMYHSSKAARDRDRLREGVLRGLGWELYRIWGTDWYRDRAGAEARLQAAVEAAIARVTLPSVTAPLATAPSVVQGLARDARPAAVTKERAVPVKKPALPEPAARPSFPVSALAHSSRRRVASELQQIRQTLARPVVPAPRETADARRKREGQLDQLRKRAVDLEAFLNIVPGAQRTVGGPLVAPGRLVGLSFGDSDTVEKYEISSQKRGTNVVSPFTELGAALLWREAGSRVEYTDGRGVRSHVRIVHVRD